jgi:glycosyltransferase involved in cell wall biosynthesis
MKKQNVNLCVIELAFGNDAFDLPDDDNLLRLRARSVLWQKERMLNYALSHLPNECKYIAWIDGDVLFSTPTWVDRAVEMFEKGYDILQLFQEVKHLPPQESQYRGDHIMHEWGLVWQSEAYPDFIENRKKGKLLYATTGFAWAGRRELFENAGGFYDKHVLGANDNIIIDCCLNTFELHHYYKAGKGTLLLDNMMEWAKRFGNPKAGCLHDEIYHLFHGAKKNRGYLTREDVLKIHSYDPLTDIRLENNVYEWATDKPGLHKDVNDYFASRKEDNNEL